MVLTYSSSFCKGCTVSSCLLCKYQPTKVHDFGSYGQICTGESCHVCKTQGTSEGAGIIGANNPEPNSIVVPSISNIVNLYNYVIIRTRYAGIHCGFLQAYDLSTKHICLKEARRIWYWAGAFTLTALVLNGFKNAKLSLACPQIVIVNVEEIIPVSEEIQKLLSEHPAHDPEDQAVEDSLEQFRRILVFGKDDCGNGSGSNRYGKDFYQINEHEWNGAGISYNPDENAPKPKEELEEKFGGSALDVMFLNGKGVGKGV